ncbi:hypothetical protein BC828DRAFT_431560 [Blastocladiella britannica]|nr:hypothetical protein BC828DRAFT_431560 [Blastocladiella britannica]
MLSTSADPTPLSPYPEQDGLQEQHRNPPPTRTVIRAYPMPLDVLRTLCQLVPALAAVPPTYTVPMLQFDCHKGQQQQQQLSSSTLNEPLRLMLYRTQKQYRDGMSEDPDHAPELLLADTTPLLLSFCFTTPFSTTPMSHGSAMPDEIRVSSVLSSIDQMLAATRTVYQWCVGEMRALGFREPWDPDAITPTSWDLLGEAGPLTGLSPKGRNPAAFLHLGSAASLSSEVLVALTDLMPDLCQTQRCWTDTDVWINAEYPLAVHVYQSNSSANKETMGWVADRPRSLDARRIATATFVSPLTALLDCGPRTRMSMLIRLLMLPPEACIPSVAAATIADRAYRWAVGAVRGAGGHVQCEPVAQAEIDEALLAQFAAHVQTIQQQHLFRY